MYVKYVCFNTSNTTQDSNIKLGKFYQHSAVSVIKGLMMSQSKTIFQKSHLLTRGCMLTKFQK